jgi:ribosomal protein L11 methyltransferase
MDPVAVNVTVTESQEDLATAILWELGTLGIEVRSAATGLVSLLAYFPARDALLSEVRTALGPLAGARAEATAVPDVDWVARFRESFRSFRVGGFYIAPPWDLPATLLPGERLLVLDPGRAFGTGTHETTRLCLRAVERAFREGRPTRVLDIGTGTGILAVAAALLGAPRVTGIETDPEALSSARAHARLNHVPLDLVMADGGRGLRAGAFDLVLANITAPLLRERCEEISALPRAGGVLVLSGLLAEEADAVRVAYGRCGRPETTYDGEWAAHQFTLPS